MCIRDSHYTIQPRLAKSTDHQIDGLVTAIAQEDRATVHAFQPVSYTHLDVYKRQDVDAAKCKRAGITPDAVLSTLSGYYGGQYVSNINRFSTGTALVVCYQR